MDKANLDLFKQALSEGISNRFDNMANNCNEEIACSEKHELAMRAIVYGKADTKRVLSPKMKRIIAILVAAALLLTSCCAIFRNEIREIVEKTLDLFIQYTYSDNNNGKTLETNYELTYVPDGYVLENSSILPVNVQYIFTNPDNETLQFDQYTINGTYIYVDIQSDYSEVYTIQNYTVYYKRTNISNLYIWNDGKYTLSITSSLKLDYDELKLIIEGIN